MIPDMSHEYADDLTANEKDASKTKNSGLIQLKCRHFQRDIIPRGTSFSYNTD